ncbi:GNAT family N-acetyltransferase [Desulfosporosinus orientis]|uniref:GNAT family N-acetyltransferase n=1 Tax=Desulfosporosinus orientis TaxID=1563 RepID=UPI0013053BB7|nr:GNAT family N-acetyltransferase [Desulfosporosinus orientis]
MKASFENSPVNQIIIAKDNGIPIGYVFSTTENFPNKVGCLNHLFFKESYRGMGIGSKLLKWLEERVRSRTACLLKFGFESEFLVLKPHFQQIINFILINDIRLLVIGSDLEQFMLHFLNGFIQAFTKEGDMVGPDLEGRINEVRFHPLVALGV